ncbi:MAG: glutaredoxin family protein [Thermomicrobiales bacterium]|jgi:mycoredoxin|nr:glutaredoxin family protein [Thermomicrobiales bacterium]
MVRPTQVIVYTTTWCPDCRAAKRYLDQRGIAYDEINIEETPGAAEQVEAWSGGYRTVPTFNVGGAIVVDFDRRALDAALVAAGD